MNKSEINDFIKHMFVNAKILRSLKIILKSIAQRGSKIFQILIENTFKSSFAFVFGDFISRTW